MHPAKLRNRLVEYTIQHSGYINHRGYLGMSRIAECPRALYFEVIEGKAANERHHLICHIGYLLERDLVSRLSALGLYRPGRELRAFDGRFIGHTDGEMDGDLLEIKTTTQEKLNEIRRTGRIPRRHFLQVQTYMNHGGYRRANVVYLARDTGDIWVDNIAFSKETAIRCDKKAMRILDAIDRREPPACECGRCR